LEGSLETLSVNLEEQRSHYQREIREAQLRDLRQARLLNIAMALAGCAFLATTVASVAWMIENSLNNARMLSDISSSIRDVKLSIDRQLSLARHVPAETVSTALLDRTQPARAIPVSALLAIEKTARPTVNAAAEPELIEPHGKKSGIPDVASLSHESQHKPADYNEMPAKEEALVPLKISPAAVVPVWDPEALAMLKADPGAITPREDLSGTDESPETVASRLPYEVRAKLDKGGGLFTGKNGSGNTLSVTPYPMTLETKRDTALVELTHGQDDVSTFVKGSYNIGKWLSLDTAFTQKDTEEDFAPATDEKKGFWHAKLGASLLESSVDAEIALSSIDNDTRKNFLVPADHRMMKLGSSSSWQDFDFGVSYQSVGKDFEESTYEAVAGKKKMKDLLDNDTARTEFWSYRQFGNLGIKAYASLDNTNLADDPNLPRFTTQKAGTSLNYLLSDWPRVGMTLDYASGTLESSDEPAGFKPVSGEARDVGGSLYYTGDHWSGSLAVKNATGKATSANVANVGTYYAEASYYPDDTFSISPSISYIRQKYPELNANTDTLSSSLTFNYKRKGSRLTYTLYGEHTAEENAAWNVDNSYLYTSLGVNWESGKKNSLVKQWSVELFHDQYRDNVYSDSNTGGPGIMLKLRSSPKPARRFADDAR
jgi:hypothetical protein